MDFTSLIPWSRAKNIPATRAGGDDSPFVGLHRAMNLRDGVLALRGEKKSQTESAVYRERRYGRFERSFRLGLDVDPDRVSAEFMQGVLTVTIEKKPEAERAEKRIEIKT